MQDNRLADDVNNLSLGSPGLIVTCSFLECCPIVLIPDGTQRRPECDLLRGEDLKAYSLRHHRPQFLGQHQEEDTALGPPCLQGSIKTFDGTLQSPMLLTRQSQPTLLLRLSRRELALRPLIGFPGCMNKAGPRQGSAIPAKCRSYHLQLLDMTLLRLRSVCLGEDSPNASSRLAEDYEKLVEM